MKKITLLMTLFMVVGCGATHASDSASSSRKPSSQSSQSSQRPSSSKSSSTSSGVHEHTWSDEWSYDDSGHFHVCTICGQKKDITAHTMGEWKTVNLGDHLKDEQYRHSTVKMRCCADCDYNKLDDIDVFPRLNFTFDPNGQDADFATKATSMDVERPTVKAKLTLDNCADDYKYTDLACEIKVRGNQTAGFPKKGFRIKVDPGKNFLGLNNDKKFKKWVLLADAKDSCIIRTQIGLSVSKAICQGEDKIFVSDLTPVSVYLNNEYWGYYYLAEQKETKTGRINLKVREGYEGVDTGYNFELDHYATQEKDKTDGGDPTFTISYHGYKNNEQPYSIEGRLANPGLMRTFTMNSDIYPEQEGVHLDETNNDQVRFIKERVEALFTVLYEAQKNNKAYTIGNDPDDVEHYNKAYAVTNMTPQQAVEANFDLDTWACGFIINAFACPPDLGYSSFYMSFDNNPGGEKKLRFDNPWARWKNK